MRAASRAVDGPGRGEGGGAGGGRARSRGPARLLTAQSLVLSSRVVLVRRCCCCRLFTLIATPVREIFMDRELVSVRTDAKTREDQRRAYCFMLVR